MVIYAYSTANYPEEQGVIKFDIRIASLPPGSDLPPGQMSSRMFNLRPSGKVVVCEPFGEFFTKNIEAEMIFVGSGADMAPIRSHIFGQLRRLKPNHKIGF